MNRPSAGIIHPGSYNFPDSRQFWLRVALCMFTIATLCPDAPSQQTPTPQQSKESETRPEKVPKPDQSTEPLNFSFSASVPRNRELERTIQSIPAELHSNNDARIAELIKKVLKEEKPGLVLYQGSLHQPRALSRALLLEQPSSVLEAYRRHAEPEAHEQLQAAKESNDLQLLKVVASTYPLTTSGEFARKLWNAAQWDQGQLPSSGSSTHQREPEKQLLDKGFRPSIIPAWTTDYKLSEGAIQTIQAGQRDLRENGLSPFSPWEAIFHNDLLITVTPIQIEARRINDGTLVWSRPLDQYGARILKKLSKVESPLRSWNLTRSTLFRIFGESLYSKMASDGTHLFLTEANAEGSQFDAKKKNRKTANRLTCLDLATGEEVWTNSSLAKSRAFLCGPPIVFGEELLVLAEFRHTSQINLLALDKSTGKLKRRLMLAEVSRSIESTTLEKRDDRRQSIACTIQISDGKAYCPTSAGLLAVVDLADWSVDWAYRYPRHDVPKSGTGLLHPKLGLTGFQWWSEWHEIQTLIFEDYVAFASPEGQQLTLFHRQTGNVLWTVDREDALYIATASSQHGVLLIGANSARCLDVQTGKLLWETPLNVPAGRGVSSATDYLLPDSEQGWTSINLESGEAEHSRFNLLSKWVPYNVTDLQRPRNFLTHDGALFEASFSEMRKLQRIGHAAIDHEQLSPTLRVLSELEANEAAELTNLDITVHNGDQAKHAAPQVADGHRQNELQLTQEFIRQSVTNDSNSIQTESTSTPSEQIHKPEFIRSWFRANLELALKTQQWERVAVLLGKEFTRPIAEGFATERMRRFRIDRWVAAQLAKAAKSLSDEDRERIRVSLRSAFQHRLLDSPEESEFLAQLLSSTPWSLEVEKVENDQPESLQSALSQRLLDYKQVAAKSIFLPEPQSNSDPSSWPVKEPTIQQTARGSSNLYFDPITIRNIDGTPHVGLNIDIEFPGHRAVRFSGKRWERPWPAYLPRSDRVLRLEHELVKAWNVNGFIVAQIGSEVYGISPLNADGHRGAKLLWPPRGATIDTLGDRTNHMLSFQSREVPERRGSPRPPAERMNEFGHFATIVGPVRAGYFCIQQKGMLVAYETATGEELWRRYDLPQQALCFGDEKTVCVLSEKTGRLQSYSALDGSVIEQRDAPISLDSILFSSGTHLLIEKGDVPSLKELKASQTPLKLTWLNLASGQVVWSREWKAGSIPFELDGRWTGVTGADRSLEIVETQSGKTVAIHELELPDPISKIVSSVGEEDILIVLSGTIEDERLLNASQQHDGYRRVMVNGPIISISRNDGSLRWESNLENSAFSVDQPVDLPVFVTAETRFPEEAMDDQIPGSRIQLFNRQTGKLLYKAESLSPVVKYSVSGNIESGVVTLVTRTAIVNVDFSQSSPSSQDQDVAK